MQKEGTSSSGEVRFSYLFLDNRLCLPEEKYTTRLRGTGEGKFFFFLFTFQALPWHTKYLVTHMLVPNTSNHIQLIINLLITHLKEKIPNKCLPFACSLNSNYKSKPEVSMNFQMALVWNLRATLSVLTSQDLPHTYQ